MTRTIRFFNTYEPVSNFYRDLVPFLLKRGEKVEIVISKGNYRKGRVLEDSLGTHPNLRLVKTANFGQHAYQGSKSKALITIVYMLSAYVYAIFGRKADVNVYLSQPPFIPFLGWLVSYLRKQPYYCVVMDVQPQMAVQMGLTSETALLARLLKHVTALSLRRANGVIVIGRCMAETVEEMGVAAERIHTIQNWADEDEIRPIPARENSLRLAQGWQDSFVIMYAGNIGVPQSFDELLDAANALRDNKKIRFVLIGGGARRNYVANRIEQLKLNNVDLLPFLHEDYTLSEILSAGDMHYVSLRDNCTGLAVPSKSYGVLAAGRPILYVGSPDAEIARLIEEEQVGSVITSGNSAELQQAIISFANDPACWHNTSLQARRISETIYSTQSALRKYAEVILDDNAVATRGASN